MATRKTRKGATKKSPPPRRGYSWKTMASVVIAIALFVGFLFYLNHLEPNSHPNHQPSSTTTSKPSTQHFDFYKLLPKLSVKVPPPKTQSPNSRHSTPHKSGTLSPITQEGTYLIQTGAFADASEANRMKARLALLGYVAHVKTSSAKGATWFRVVIGPISQLHQLNQTLQELRQHRVATLLIKITK